MAKTKYEKDPFLRADRVSAGAGVLPARRPVYPLMTAGNYTDLVNSANAAADRYGSLQNPILDNYEYFQIDRGPNTQAEAAAANAEINRVINSVDNPQKLSMTNAEIAAREQQIAADRGSFPGTAPNPFSVQKNTETVPVEQEPAPKPGQTTSEQNQTGKTPSSANGGSSAGSPSAYAPTNALTPVSDAAYQQALATLQQVQKSAPVYADSYRGQLQELYQQIVGRDPFRYDLNGDMLYQQYAQQYANNGRLAMQDTMGQAAALTGGYGSTYGQQVGQQQYDAYLQRLNDVVPELYNQAYNEWLNQGERMEQQYSMLQDMSDDEYGKYMDAYNQWLKERDYAGEVAEAEYAKYQQAQAEYEAQKAAQAAAGGSGGSGTRVGYDKHGYTEDMIRDLQRQAGLKETGVWGENEKQAYKAGYRANGDTGNGTSAPAADGTLTVSPQVKTYSEALAYMKANGVDATNDLMTANMWQLRKDTKVNTPEITLFSDYRDYLNNMVDYLMNEKYKK